MFQNGLNWEGAIFVIVSLFTLCSEGSISDDYNLSQTTQVTQKVVLWTSEVLLSHKIFPKIPILFHDVHCTVY